VPRTLRDLAILLGAFGASSAIAAALGAVNFGTALAFGQIGFALALVWVLLRS
jgi:type IV secretory pathway VirB2 component (pilin)